ncbi:MAG: hypothetical protein IRY92_05025 [Dactylosporangium sp.]|nr:hypothetical protein [Dactylosporangium sp.]
MTTTQFDVDDLPWIRSHLTVLTLTGNQFARDLLDELDGLEPHAQVTRVNEVYEAARRMISRVAPVIAQLAAAASGELIDGRRP